MYRNTRFGDVLKGFPRHSFDKLVSQKQTDKYSKGFSSWDHLVTMIYAQVSQCNSLRDVETGFNSHIAQHYHLGCRTVKRSTLADANKKRDSELFSEICQQLMTQVNRKLRRELKSFLYLLDSTSITLKGRGYDDWTLTNSTRNTQGVKLHLLISAETQTPHYFNVTTANVNDITDAEQLTIQKNATYAFDKGYCNYNWWYQIEQEGAYFVTRFKRNAALVTIKNNLIPDEAKEIILSDKIVKFKNKRPRARHINHYQKPLRQVVVAREDHDTPIILATNDLKMTALEVADCYKTRWQIELFFKWIKQNLKIKKYLGRTENAIRIQIFTALVSYLLIALYRYTKQMKNSMKDILVLIKETLFHRPEIDEYLIRKRRKQVIAINLQRQAVLF